MKHLSSANNERTNQLSPSQEPTHDEIAFIAYHLYLESGQQHGRDQEHWFCAKDWLTQTSRLSSAREHLDESQGELNGAPEVRPVEGLENSFARDEQSSANREEIRRQTAQMQRGARQSSRPPERSARAW